MNWPGYVSKYGCRLYLHDGLIILFQNALELFNVTALVGVHKVCHGYYLTVILIRFSFLKEENNE